MSPFTSYIEGGIIKCYMEENGCSVKNEIIIYALVAWPIQGGT